MSNAKIDISSIANNLGGAEFLNTSPEVHVHIIVEPLPPATTGKCLPMVYLSNKKFALSHIFFFFIRSGKRKAEDSNEDRAKREKLELFQQGIFLLILYFKE